MPVDFSSTNKLLKELKDMLQSGDIANSVPELETEKCVVCGAKTPYMKETPIDKRYYYVEGAGQLCEHCYDQLYTWKNY